jgi:hypothetical protein
LAHVDTPKGDLDASSGVLDGPAELVAVESEVYPYGTTEQFPAMRIGQEGAFLENTAHYYMECSNKGICDRESGSCECFPGYEGSACQRASCPSTDGATCSGHGTCETIKQIAARDHNNIYELWDEKASMGCVCDPGYYGADCALRECKYGADPLYYDDNSNIRYSNWTVVLAADHATTTDMSLSGYYAIVFYDHFGEDWVTGRIEYDATCADIIKALEDIPNDVIPDGSVRCVEFDSSDPDRPLDWYPSPNTLFRIFNKYTLMFPENPGKLKQIALTKFLDGLRPTLVTGESTSSLQMFVYANGFSGEDVDLVPDECEDVVVKFKRETSSGLSDLGDFTFYYSLDFSPSEEAEVQRALFKRCLGDSDSDHTFDGMADEVYNWDHGTDLNPHLVKFVDANEAPVNRICHSIGDFALMDNDHTVSGYCFEPAPAGFYAPVIFHPGLGSSDGEFVVYSNAPKDFDIDGDAANEFRVFTTKGHLIRVAADADVFTTAWPDIHSNTVYSWNLGTDVNDIVNGASPELPYRTLGQWSGGIDCEKNNQRSVIDGANPIPYDDCLRKGDHVMFFSTITTDDNYEMNPRYHNIYTVEKIYNAYPHVNSSFAAIDDETLRNRIVLDMNVNFQAARADEAGGSNAAKAGRPHLRAYKFYPAATITYVDECSGRGLCNAAEGICECFPGYTNDDCSVQNSAAH